MNYQYFYRAYVSGETGVLAVLHSLIASGHGEQILKNVYDAVDPNEVETNIKLWRYGEVCKVPIELNIEQRSNVSNVSKIDLIEMAYNKWVHVISSFVTKYKTHKTKCLCETGTVAKH